MCVSAWELHIWRAQKIVHSKSNVDQARGGEGLAGARRNRSCRAPKKIDLYQ